MFDNVIDGIFSAAFIAAILRVTTPILLPSLGALISEKAGVLNIGLEGMMLSSAFTGRCGQRVRPRLVRHGNRPGRGPLAGTGFGGVGLFADGPSSWRCFIWI